MGSFRYFKSKTQQNLDIASKAQRHITDVAHTFKYAIDKHVMNNPMLITAEGIILKTSEEIKQYSGAKQVISNSRIVLETLTHNLLVDVHKDIEIFKKTFDYTRKGFAEFKNKYVKISYEHILGIELRWNDKKGIVAGISGFHHDFMNAIENSKIVSFVNKVVNKHGCYTTDIIIDGITIKGKTFFPAHWSREQVIGQIYEAYDNFIKNSGVAKLELDGKYSLKAFTNEGIEIKMYITKKGEIVTAYPLMEEVKWNLLK